MKAWLFVLLVALCNVFPVSASEPFQIDGTESWPIVSSSNQQGYQLYVRLPRGYQRSKRNYPVAILQDTGYAFPLASGVLGLMGGRDIEDVILVGVSYSDGVSPQISRTRDYTPTYAPDEAGGHSVEAQKHSGKADAYIAFIENDVLPFIEAKYRAADQERIFIGHSFGGLLGAYMLLVNAQLFDHYILGSPSLWYDKEAMFRLEEVFAKTHDAIPANVLMYIGGEERHSKRSDMVADLLRFEQILQSRGYKHLSVKAHVLEGASHFSVFPLLLTDGLRKVLARKAS